MAKKHSSLIYSVFFTVMLGMAPIVSARAAADANLPVTHGNVIHNYARITFEWPTTVYFTAKAQGKSISITFDRKATPDFSALLKSLYPYVTSAKIKGDGRTVVLSLNKPYRIRTFVSDNINGIDLLGINEKDRENAMAPIVAKAATPKPVDTRLFAALSPAAGEATPPAAAEPAPVAAPAAAPAVPAPEPVAAAPVVVPAPEAAPAPQAAAEPAIPEPAKIEAEPSDSSARPAEQVVVTPKTPSDTVKVNVSAAMDNTVLRFPFAERMAMAVFVRAHTLWVVLPKSVKLDLSDFDSMHETVIGKAELIPAPRSTILRMSINDGVYPMVSKEEGTFNLAILVTNKKRGLESPLKIAINTDPPAAPHVFIPALEVTDSVTVKDPLIGDTLIITPLFNVGEGVPIDRDFIEFSLLATAQGVVVNKKSDDVSMVQLRNGLRVSVTGGATLTPGLPEVVGASAGNSLEVVTLFPYTRWKAESADAIRMQARELASRVVFTENLQDANNARYRLAQLFLSDGMAPEAIAMLEGIKRTNPAYYRSAKLSALHGAANFLMYRFGDAARDFAASELNDNKEIDYWRAMIADLLGNSDQNYDYLTLNPDYISKYPPLFRQRLAIVAADRAIASKQYNIALKIFDILHQENIIEPIEQYVNFLLAKVSLDTGQEKEATDIWDRLAVDMDHPFVRARAEFSRLSWGMEHNTVSKDQAIDRLERLRLYWHGDGLELQVLTILGDLYAERQDYVNAMRIWNGGVIAFPNTTNAIEMSRRMQEAFIIMFNEGGADKLPPLDALALYYEYRNYTPSGNTGNAMIERLADKLLSVDLLDQAASLLDHQMHFQAEKEQRSLIGAKLASIHLMAHQPRKALQVLQDSMYGENPLVLRLRRNRITAQAMAELGQSEKALQTLGQDDSPEAEGVRISVYWQQKDWPKVTSSIENLLKNRKDLTAPVTMEESELLLQLSLAYVFQNDTAQLHYLKDYFGPLMAGNPNEKLFQFVTSGDMPLTTTNFDQVVKHLSDTRQFIDNYRARIQTTQTTPAAANSL